MTRTLCAMAAVLLAAAPGCKKTDDSRSEAAGDTAGEGAAAPSGGGTLTVYSGRSEKLIAPALAAFEEHAGVDLQIKYGDTAELAAALLAEGARSPADVFLAQDASSLAFLASKGVFAELDDALLERVPAGFRGEDGTWVGLSGRARVLAYHTKLAPEELPEDIDALTEPRWKGKVGWAPENASFQSFVAAMIQLRGAEATKAWLEAMKANQPVDYPKNTPAVQAVARGEVDVALVNHYYLHRLKEEHGEDFPVANHYFRTGDAAALVNLSGGAVLSSSAKQEQGEQLLAFLLSEAGQKHFVEGNHEFPVASGAASPSGLPSADSLNAPDIDPAALENLEQTVALLRETGVLE